VLGTGYFVDVPKLVAVREYQRLWLGIYPKKVIDEGCLLFVEAV
jgi:hypothetical protein